MNAEVSSSLIWGEGSFRYAVYKIEISFRDGREPYSIYRRYRQFYQLHFQVRKKKNFFFF